jgi:hypothetical protein
MLFSLSVNMVLADLTHNESHVINVDPQCQVTGWNHIHVMKV